MRHFLVKMLPVWIFLKPIKECTIRSSMLFYLLLISLKKLVTNRNSIWKDSASASFRGKRKEFLFVWRFDSRDDKAVCSFSMPPDFYKRREQQLQRPSSRVWNPFVNLPRLLNVCFNKLVSIHTCRLQHEDSHTGWIVVPTASSHFSFPRAFWVSPHHVLHIHQPQT